MISVKNSTKHDLQNELTWFILHIFKLYRKSLKRVKISILGTKYLKVRALTASDRIGCYTVLDATVGEENRYSVDWLTDIFFNFCLQTATHNNVLGIKQIHAKILLQNYFSDRMHPNEFLKDSQIWYYNSCFHWVWSGNANKNQSKLFSPLNSVKYMFPW